MNIITIDSQLYAIGKPKYKNRFNSSIDRINCTSYEDQAMNENFKKKCYEALIIKHSPFQVGDSIDIECSECEGDRGIEQHDSIWEGCDSCEGAGYQFKTILSIELKLFTPMNLHDDIGITSRLEREKLVHWFFAGDFLAFKDIWLLLGKL